MASHLDEKAERVDSDHVSAGSETPRGKTEHIEVGQAHTHAPAETINGVPYRRTKLFVGSFWAIGFGVLACYAGFAMPANTLSLINDDIGAALGLIGSIIAATAHRVDVLIGANVLIGFAASSQISFIYVTGELVPVRHRFIINDLINAVNIPIGVFGPVIARSFVLHTSAGWRWNYYLTTILNAVSLICWALFYFPPDFQHLHRVRSRWQEIKSIDYVGVVLFSGGLLLFLMGLSWGGAQYPWNSAHVLAILIVGFCTIIIFILYETFSGVYRPLVPMYIFRDYQYDAIVVLTTVGGMIYYSMTVIYPTALGVLYSTNTMTVGWLSCAVGGGTVAGQVLGGLFAIRIGFIKYQMVLAACMMTAFIGGLAAQTPDNRHLSTAFATLGSFGVGYIEILAATAATFVIRNQRQMGTPNGIFGSIRSAGGVLATTIYLTILLNVVASNEKKLVVPAVLKAGLPETSLKAFLTALASGSVAAIEKVPGVSPAIIAVGSQELVASYVDALRKVFLTSIAWGGLSVIAALAVKPFTKEELTGAIIYHLGENHGPAGSTSVEAHSIEDAPLD